MRSKQVLSDVTSKYSEWLEMAGDNSAVLLNEILVGLLVKEKEKNEYYEKLIKTYERNHAAKSFVQ